VASNTDAKVLGGAISAFAREGRRTTLIAIGAGSINAAVKGLAIARRNVEEEAIDLLCKPEFTEARSEIGKEGGGEGDSWSCCDSQSSQR
jgi:stage V sporulation protein S